MRNPFIYVLIISVLFWIGIIVSINKLTPLLPV